VLLCPGNIIGGAKRQQMTLLAHGSAFQHLPCRRHGYGGDRMLVQVLVGVCTCVYIMGGGGVARA